MTNAAATATHTDFTTAGLIASLPTPYDTYVVGDTGEFRPVNESMTRFIVTISKNENFWVQDTRDAAVVLITGSFYAAINAMLVLNVHRHDSAAADVIALAEALR